MKLLSLRAENFRCVRKASVQFGPGLNVLYGPNDLGKSSLAEAIRAVLLLQASSREYEGFLNWNGTGHPHVELVFESEPQRIWRVRKDTTWAKIGLRYDSWATSLNRTRLAIRTTAIRPWTRSG